MRNVAFVLCLACLDMAGCVAEPAVYTVRMTPQVERIEERTLSLQLLAPRMVSPECVFHRGELVTAIINNSSDKPSELELGRLVSGKWHQGALKLLIHESGKTRVLLLSDPPAPDDGLTLWLVARIPISPAEPTASWKKERPEERATISADRQ